MKYLIWQWMIIFAFAVIAGCTAEGSQATEDDSGIDSQTATNGTAGAEGSAGSDESIDTPNGADGADTETTRETDNVLDTESVTHTTSGTDSGVGSGIDTSSATAEGTEIPEDTVSEVATADTNDTGSTADSDNGTETDTIADTGSDTGADTVADTGPDTGADTSTETVVDTGTETVVDTGTDIVVDTGIDTVPDTNTDTVIKVMGVEHSGANCGAVAGVYGLNNPFLPNPLEMHNGDEVTTMDAWRCRRDEIITDIETYEVGPKPAPPSVSATLTGNLLEVDVTTAAGTITLDSTIQGTGNCLLIGMGGSYGPANGCRTMVFYHDQVVQNEHTSGNAWPDDPYYQLYPELWETGDNGGATIIENGNARIGNYSAWAWGVSRLIDGLALTQDAHGIDMEKIGVSGCSYAGKMALFAGAMDERIALTIVQESGGGGAASWRTSEDWELANYVDVESIDDTNWGWFMDSLLESRQPHLLPHDHHELMALVAPRALVVLPGDPENDWLAAHSAYVSFMAAREVWQAMGIADRAGIDVHNPGGLHCSASPRQAATVQAFVDRFLRDQPANTNIIHGLTDDWGAAIDWTTQPVL